MFQKNYIKQHNSLNTLISEGHVTLKTGVSQRCVTEINYIIKYIKLGNQY